MGIVKGSSILARSGQAWKLKAALLFLLVGSVAIAASHAMPRSPSNAAPLVNLAGISMSLLGGLVFPALSIRCPRCRARWYWLAIRSKRLDEWLLWILGAEACLECGFNGDSSRRAAGPRGTSGNEKGAAVSRRVADRPVILGTPMKPRTLEELIDVDDPAWPIVRSWIDEAHNLVEVLPPDLAVRDSALLSSQVATRSPLGAVIYETGGLLVDHGWVRVLGSGSARLPRAIHEWNVGRTSRGAGPAPGFYLVADDAAGGFFALNGGALGEALGDVYYHAPDSLAWEPMGMPYSAFLRWLFTPDLGEWSAGLRWSGWREEVEDLPGDRAILFYPFLFTREGSLESSERRPVPIGELYALYLDGESASGGRSSETTSREDSE